MKHVVPIQSVTLRIMIRLSARVKKTLSATHCKAANVNVNRQETAHLLKNVNGSNAYLFVAVIVLHILHHKRRECGRGLCSIIFVRFF